LKRGIWSGQIAFHSDRKEASNTARLLRSRNHTGGRAQSHPVSLSFVV